jgi:hypothetical protein
MLATGKVWWDGSQALSLQGRPSSWPLEGEGRPPPSIPHRLVMVYITKKKKKREGC